jgi:hypothetical protein
MNSALTCSPHLANVHKYWQAGVAPKVGSSSICMASCLAQNKAGLRCFDDLYCPVDATLLMLLLDQN